ncbi:unnamed protein product [Amoebophrya sp. A120]|nr:unnamed protein product [Amoebophrya sp. A120]|eukprot:GSA120T00006044001.1
MDLLSQEDANGVRMSWNLWPNTKADMNRIVVPLGCIYSPLKQVTDLKLVGYDPLVCKSGTNNCVAVFNPFCYVDFRAKTWTCNFCGFKQQLPPYYAENISESQLPQEKMSPTIEYLLPNTSCMPPVFLFVLDTALNNPEDWKEFEKAKEALQSTLQSMPQNSLVGFITFGAMVHVHELGFQGELLKSYAFMGTKQYGTQQIAGMLGVSMRNDPRGNTRTESAKRFLLPISECEFALNNILEDLRTDRWPVEEGRQRCQRCTGGALNVAVGLLENLYAGHAGRIILLVSGPCTAGPGAIVSRDKRENMRSHLDLQKEQPNARYCKGASNFYLSVAARAVSTGHAIDIFASSLDQVGLHEMRCLVERSGGHMVMADGFSQHVFRDSFKKVLSKTDSSGQCLDMGFNARITVQTSKEIKVCGAIGPVCSMQKAHPSVADTQIGESNTITWATSALDQQSSVAFYFELADDGADGKKQNKQGQAAFLQFQTLYHHPSGKKRLRVTTVARAYSDPELLDIGQAFDQECAAVLLARFCMHQAESTESFDALRRLDRMLIRIISKFAAYNRGDPSSFQLAEEFTLFPQFIFYLRRSPLLETFNCSPDETAFYRVCMLKSNVVNSLVMIQPALMEYSFDSLAPVPVLLDSLSLKKNVILLLDTFFHVVVWRGETVQEWYNRGYQELPEYANFKELLIAPAKDAKDILEDRFPVPKFVQTYANGSQARFVLSRVNPSKTHTQLNDYSQVPPGDSSATVITEDISLRNFMESLIKFAVA